MARSIKGTGPMKRLLLLSFAAVLIAAADPATETEHKVTDGETLSGIAERAKVPASVIAAANGLRAPYAVKSGQVLQIPRQRAHTVAAGETGFAIAIQYGVPFKNIAIANGLEEPYTVKVGQKLIIPAVIKPVAIRASEPAEPYFTWPHDGKILLGYGKRADGGGHDGIDIAVKKGDMVRASANGMVVRVDNNHKRFGRFVVIEHGRGWLTAYGHLERATVTKGEIVKSGERIGIAGSTDKTKQPELHFEILQNDEEVDPAKKLPDRSGG